MKRHWTSDDILELARHYQPACVLAAAVDLDLFSALAPKPLTAAEAAHKLRADQRGMTVLLDALAALQLLDKRGARYTVPRGVADLLTSDGERSILAMPQHQANCMRRWVQLAMVIKSGRPAQKIPSVRGADADAAAFIGAMHNVSQPNAAEVIKALKPIKFRHLLDIGGASGTWTVAFLRANRYATATLFDLPHVIPMARQRLAEAKLLHRARLVEGDFYTDLLPRGADLAWVSAIVHQNSRTQNRRLFRKIFRSLSKGGHIAIRDILMDRSRTSPRAGALFAINMLVATDGGGTFTFDELREDLESAGFTGAKVVRRDEGMNSVLAARKKA